MEVRARAGGGGGRWCSWAAPRDAPCDAPRFAPRRTWSKPQCATWYMVQGARCCTRGALYHARFEDMVRRRHGYVRDAAVVRAVAVLVEHARVRVDLPLLPLLHNLSGGRNLRLPKSTAAAGGRTAGAACGSERGERRLATERAELHHRLRQPMSRRGGRRRQHQSLARHEQDGGGEH